MPGYVDNARSAMIFDSKVNLGANIGTPWSCEGCPIMSERVSHANELLGKLRHLSTAIEAPQVVIPASELKEGEAAETFEELLLAKEWIDDKYRPCRNDSVGIFNSGKQVGMYCASADEDIYFNQTATEGLE